MNPTPNPSGPASSQHPLLWAAVLVWLSVEAIGDALLALRTTVVNTASNLSNTPTSTPS
jgi:hypothetical protein